MCDGERADCTITMEEAYAIARDARTVRVVEEDLPRSIRGMLLPSGVVVVRRGMREARLAATVEHETAHALLVAHVGRHTHADVELVLSIARTLR